ncbi:hypothetical protein [Vibrio brasiliensis]|uniref:Lipoprotein n=1 Tax=Vibrio brasiliensis LMG 20546 TaxID=945543 RepID=E8LPD6_9VIBR|nr:hypothetical protein [Vibrio brasiliensis]EGA67598.1 hypothetical protein VIBR0546_13207 [Vibrio brasiliensis LMG 20546]
MHNGKVHTILTGLATVTLAGCSMFSPAERDPYYPQLRDTTYSSEDITVIESDNVLKAAIKHNEFVLVEEKQTVNQAIELVFAEAIDNRAVSVEDLRSEQFHRALEEVIKQFTCELYASKQPADSIQLCPQQNQIVDNALDYLPFEQGLRFAHRISTIKQDHNDTLQLEMFLKSTHERPLESLWGAVHELGKFKGSRLAPEQLVLTINLKAYKKSPSDHTWKYMYPEPLVFFVVLPSVEHLIQRPNEIESMDFAYRTAKLLVVDSR